MRNHYRLADKYTASPDNAHEHFQLHSHEYYEIYLFFEGDCRFIVEGKYYRLEPYDMLIINKNEFHQVYHDTPTPYHRITLQISSDFFHHYGCEQYEARLMQASVTAGNKIPGNVVRSSGLYDAFMRYKKYTDNYENNRKYPVENSMIVEIMHIINQASLHTTSDYTNASLQPLITYLNQHFTEDITLDFLQEKFFLSKYHLCRIFRNTTGLTVHEYLRKKRLAHVRELKSQGRTISDAAIASGFRDYSSFYRAYQKEYGVSPRVDLES